MIHPKTVDANKMTQNVIRSYEDEKKQTIPFENTLKGMYKDFGSFYGLIMNLIYLIRTGLTMLVFSIPTIISKIEKVMVSYDELAMNIRRVREWPNLWDSDANHARCVDILFERIVLILLPLITLAIYKYISVPILKNSFCVNIDGDKCLQYSEKYYLASRLHLIWTIATSITIGCLLHYALVHPRATITIVTGMMIIYLVPYVTHLF